MQWKNTTNKTVLIQAWAEIWRSWRRACTDVADPRAPGSFFDPRALSAFHDSFAGGTLPLVAQRPGLEVCANGFNPVPALINKVRMETFPDFTGNAPVRPQARKKRAAEALACNGLVQSWPEIARLAREGGQPKPEQAALFEGGEA